jgi:tetratricopeptide (TPR) repeat protein
MRTILSLLSLAFVAAFCIAACERSDEPAPAPARALDLVLVPHAGDDEGDEAIQRAQTRVGTGQQIEAALGHLGWAYVAKARASRDEGYYRLAQACGEAIIEETAATTDSRPPEALLLLGHVAATFHRFSEAESIAAELVQRRGLPFDHLLLGDAFMEQGKIEEAIASYQTGVDLKPGLQSYARVGWMRWLIGDLEGAIEATELAAGAASPRDRESVAWVRSRLGHFRMLSGDRDGAKEELAIALAALPDYPPALVLEAKLALADGDTETAIASLRRAVAIEPLPEPLWLLAEVLIEAGQDEEAKAVFDELARTGERGDPRTHALFLATTGRSPEIALRLAEAELEERADYFTRDALAWALFANGRIAEARTEMDHALAGGTIDPRLFFHAAVIAHAAGETAEAADWIASAHDLYASLLPSERRALEGLAKNLPDASPLADGTTNPRSEDKP